MQGSAKPKAHAPLKIEIHHFIYFPTPLYTKTRCQAGFCVCWGFLFIKEAVVDNVLDP